VQIASSQENDMRSLSIIAVLAAATLLGGWTSTGDGQGAYCHQTRQYENCGYPSLEACLATRSAVGGTCTPNPKFVPAEERRQRRRS
jgi:hypothetical protein